MKLMLYNIIHHTMPNQSLYTWPMDEPMGRLQNASL